MSNNQYLLIEEEYRAWVKSLRPQQHVGIPDNLCYCAIAHFLSWRYHKNFEVKLDGEGYYISVCTTQKESESHRLPSWAQREAAIFDSIPSIAELRNEQPVTKQMYTRYML